MTTEEAEGWGWGVIGGPYRGMVRRGGQTGVEYLPSLAMPGADSGAVWYER